MAFPIVKMENKPPKRPLPVGLRWPSAVPRPATSTTPNRSSDVEAMSHTYAVVSIGYNDAVQIRPQKYPFPWSDCQTPIPASSLEPSDLWCQTAAGCDLPFFHNALDRQTDRPTDRSRESLMTIGRSAPRATRPNNNTERWNLSERDEVSHSVLECWNGHAIHRLHWLLFTVRLHVMQRTVLLTQFCPSVCPSVGCVYCDKTK